ncbi:hypothetical protein [Umezawaea sp. Da 62-37]|uniref:hypothetical protein n=1 Tax=Umezawaea sp. Da 62-37 TaxID=3075927 RepID=UPI0028F70EE3|nr:hypothetical protein [Umezawaea sp. Da 62-37]WNV86127.1 hypothetical protein RM788_49795 [Umezawaea sp. Da 62-37]
MDRRLADALFVPVERWGWEPVSQDVRPHPDADTPPEWFEPPEVLGTGIRTVSGFLAKGVLGLAALALGFLYVNNAYPYVLIGFGLFFLVLLGFVGLLAWSPVWWTRLRRRVARDRFDAARRAWEDRLTAHDEDERRRVEAAGSWRTLAVGSPRRVFVFGGTPRDCWAGLVTTVGSSYLGRGGVVAIADFTEEGVAAELAHLAGQHGTPVLDAARHNLLGGLSVEETAELLANAVSELDRSADPLEQRVLHLRLLTVVLEALDGPTTFDRVAAGLRVLAGEPGRPLSAEESARLTAAVAVVGAGEQARTRLARLAGLLDLMSPADAPDAEATAVLWRDTGLSVLATGDGNSDRKELLDGVVFHRLLRDLRHRRPDLLVVAGVEAFGARSLRAATRQAQRSGMTLVLLSRRLDEASESLLGDSSDATIIMRPGTAADAVRAADFIGREHRFVRDRLTDEVGRTITRGVAHTAGQTEWPVRVVWPGGAPGAVDRWSATTALTTSTSDTVSKSESDMYSHSETTSRVYEYAVEPKSLQELPVTAFLLVEPTTGGRRVVAGDCNPGIALLDGVR